MIFGIPGLLAASRTVAAVASASYSWSGYHWAASNDGFSAALSSNLTSNGRFALALDSVVGQPARPNSNR